MGVERGRGERVAAMGRLEGRAAQEGEEVV